MPVVNHLHMTHKDLDLVGRPIISGLGSLNGRVGQWVDTQLQPLVKDLPSFLRDTEQLLGILYSFQWKENYIWVKCDVTSLYSCIPHRLGLEAITFYLDRYCGLTCIQKELILDSLGYLLGHNFFQFDGAFSRQWWEASMGAKFSPSLANLYMDWWERTHIYGKHT